MNPALRYKPKREDLAIAWNEKYIILKKLAKGENAIQTFPSLFEVINLMINGLERVRNESFSILTTDEIWNKNLDIIINKLISLKK